MQYTSVLTSGCAVACCFSVPLSVFPGAASAITCGFRGGLTSRSARSFPVLRCRAVAFCFRVPLSVYGGTKMVCVDSTMSFDVGLREQLSCLFFSVCSANVCLAHHPCDRECYRFVVGEKMCWGEAQSITSCHTMTNIFVLQALSI